jgi:hypothetical protein
MLDKSARLYLQGLDALYFFPNVCDLVVEKDLHTTQILKKTSGVQGVRLASSQGINPHFQPEERLDNSVMKLLHKMYAPLGSGT